MLKGRYKKKRKEELFRKKTVKRIHDIELIERKFGNISLWFSSLLENHIYKFKSAVKCQRVNRRCLMNSIFCGFIKLGLLVTMVTINQLITFRTCSGNICTKVELMIIRNTDIQLYHTALSQKDYKKETIWLQWKCRIVETFFPAKKVTISVFLF